MSETKQTLPVDREYGLKPGAEKFPLMLVLSFVYPCNALCPHCPYTNSNIRMEYRDAPFMDGDIFRKIAKETGEFNAYLRITGGGEPMLHPQASELLVYAKEVGCKVGIITNGSLFNEINSRQLLSAGIDMIEFSVDACDEETYKVVRRGLDWKVLLENVTRMVRMREDLGSTSKIVVSCVDQKGVNSDEVERFWIEEIGVDYMIKRKFLTWGINTTIDGQESADPSAYIDTEQVPCPFIFERLNIDSRGNVMVCGYDISAHTELGNVTTQSIQDIWAGPGFSFYRDKHLSKNAMDIPLCAGCPDWKYRSWDHNYWKVVENAERNRGKKLKNA